MKNAFEEIEQHTHDQLSRRSFLSRTSLGLGAAALSSLLDNTTAQAATTSEGALGKPHFAPKVKRVIYLLQSGAPSQLELFDYKPKLEQMWGQNLPE